MRFLRVFLPLFLALSMALPAVALAKSHSRTIIRHTRSSQSCVNGHHCSGGHTWIVVLVLVGIAGATAYGLKQQRS
jgi:hypothetical protein